MKEDTEQAQEPEQVVELSGSVKTKLKDVLETVLEEVVEEQIPPNAPPGTKIGKGLAARKVPFTDKHLRDQFGEATFIPEETIPVTIQGVLYWLREGVEATVPTCVKTVYETSRQAKRSMLQANFDTGYGPVVVSPGAGAFPNV